MWGGLFFGFSADFDFAQRVGYMSAVWISGIRLSTSVPDLNLQSEGRGRGER